MKDSDCNDKIKWWQKRDSLREYYKNLADTKERKLNIKIK